MPVVHFILQRPFFVVFTVLIISLVAGYEAYRLPVITSIEALIRKDDPNRIFYSEFRKTFGADDAVVVAIGAKEVFAHNVLEYIKSLTEEIESLDGVEDCLSITSTETIMGLKEDFIVEPLFEDGYIPSGKNELKEIKAKAFSNPLIVGNIINTSSNATLILVRTASHEDDQEFESRLLARIHEILDRTPRPPDIQGPFVAGWPVVDVSMATYMNKDVMTFVPISAFLMCITVFLFVRSWPYTALIMTIMLLSLLWTMAALKVVGGAMSPLTSILPPLIMALSLSDGIHIITTYLRLKDIVKTVKEAWWPCALTSLTTAIGFLSLLVSDIPAIRHFGAAAAAGMGIELFLCFTLLITLVPRVRRVGSGVSSTNWYPFMNFLEKVAQAVPSTQGPVLLVTVVFLLLAAIGISRLRVDTNMLDYFYKSSDVRKAASFVDNTLGGANTIEISLKTLGEHDFLEPQNIQRLEEIFSLLKKRSGITEVTGPNSFLKLMNRAFHSDNAIYYKVPDSREMSAQYLLLYDGDEMSHFLSSEEKWARISARTNLHGTEDLSRLYSWLKESLEGIFRGTGVEYKITGKTYLFNHMAQDIVSSQVESLALASLIIFGIMFVVLKDLKLGLISIVPNVLPIAGNLAIMGFLGIPINTATAIISAVAIGIAVDDTIHFIVHFKRERDQGGPGMAAIRNALIKKGRAAISTSLVLVVGFGVLVVSNFIPTAQFGVLSALIMLMALTADIVVLPVLLTIGEGKLHN